MPGFEMRWRDALFASWPVDPDLIAPRIPDGLAVDTHDGQAYLSVVPFVLEDVRPAGLPAVLGRRTPELNLRTYVSADREAGGDGREGGDGAGAGARGIYFFNLDAADPLGVLGARLWTHLPYYLATMDVDREGGRVRFRSRRRTPGARAARFDAAYGPADAAPEPADPGSLDAFLVERYRFFAEDGDGALVSAAIDHEPWRLRPATWEVRRNTLFRASGFASPEGDPHLLYGEPLEVSASATERWDAPKG